MADIALASTSSKGVRSNSGDARAYVGAPVSLISSIDSATTNAWSLNAAGLTLTPSAVASSFVTRVPFGMKMPGFSIPFSK